MIFIGKEERTSKLDLSYIAGFFDGEGCILLSKRGRASNSYYLKVIIGQSNKQILEDIRDYFGLGVIITQKRLGGRTFYFYQLSSNQATKVLRQLLAFLKLKEAEAKLAIEFQDRVVSTGTGGRAQYKTAWQKPYYEQMANLKGGKRKHVQ